MIFWLIEANRGRRRTLISVVDAGITVNICFQLFLQINFFFKKQFWLRIPNTSLFLPFLVYLGLIQLVHFVKTAFPVVNKFSKINFVSVSQTKVVEFLTENIDMELTFSFLWIEICENIRRGFLTFSCLSFCSVYISRHFSSSHLTRTS